MKFSILLYFVGLFVLLRSKKDFILLERDILPHGITKLSAQYLDFENSLLSLEISSFVSTIKIFYTDMAWYILIFIFLSHHAVFKFHPLYIFFYSINLCGILDHFAYKAPDFFIHS